MPPKCSIPESPRNSQSPSRDIQLLPTPVPGNGRHKDKRGLYPALFFYCLFGLSPMVLRVELIVPNRTPGSVLCAQGSLLGGWAQKRAGDLTWVCQVENKHPSCCAQFSALHCFSALLCWSLEAACHRHFTGNR